MLWLYNVAIRFYNVIVKVYSLFNSKAKLFIKGRINVFNKIEQQVNSSTKHIWFHFASLGEFEQGRPVLEKIKKQYPDKSIVITFFSPSGYEIRKNYALADGVFYLPLDTSTNARKLIDALNPEIAVFTKYEYWYHYFKTLNKRNIPIFIISGIFRADQVFFKWYGSLNRKILSFVDHFFLQNAESKNLLSTIGIDRVSISGDTRFDRVAENAASPKQFDKVSQFCGQARVLVAGSTWLPDERLLSELIAANPDWKFIIAPHEIAKTHIDELQKLIPGALKYSELVNAVISNDAVPDAHSWPGKESNRVQTLIIDNIGLLSSLYQYGDIAYIGGGFGAGIHNTLEAAAFGLPIMFGPKYQKFQEAKELIAAGAAITINSQQELDKAFKDLTVNDDAGKAAKQYVIQNTGSTDQILKYMSQYF